MKKNDQKPILYSNEKLVLASQLSNKSKPIMVLLSTCLSTRVKDRVTLGEQTLFENDGQLFYCITSSYPLIYTSLD